MLRLIRVTLILLTLPLPAMALSPQDARHLLARTGFAAAPQAIEDLAPLGQDAAVARILDQARKDALTAPPAWTRNWAPPDRPMKDLSKARRRARQEQRRARALELKTWWIREMLATPSPITEVMTLFWHNHFTSELKKVKSPVLMYRQNQLLRRHALGNFATLLRQVARDPAMLLYLDGARSRKGEPNENFARELLELFTLTSRRRRAPLPAGPSTGGPATSRSSPGGTTMVSRISSAGAAPTTATESWTFY
jgi:uncharacterized protein (DUF1800 family)